MIGAELPEELIGERINLINLSDTIPHTKVRWHRMVHYSRVQHSEVAHQNTLSNSVLQNTTNFLIREQFSIRFDSYSITSVDLKVKRAIPTLYEAARDMKQAES